jgi:hypothetical protein
MALVISAPCVARAEQARDEAQALFASARALMAAGEFGEACPKLERSEALDPGIGTQFNLARCYELSGRLASAYAAYERAIAEMHAAGQTSREVFARKVATALEPRLSHVTLEVEREGMEPGFELRLDGVQVERAAWGTAIPVDPGPHLVSASAPASATWRKELAVDGEAQSLTVAVPSLTPILAITPTSFVPAAPREAPATRGRPQRMLAVVLGALGVGGIGVGSYYGLRSMSLTSQSGPFCNGGCDTTGLSLRADAHAAGDASTVTFALGGVFLAAGAILWLTAPADSPSR